LETKLVLKKKANERSDFKVVTPSKDPRQGPGNFALSKVGLSAKIPYITLFITFSANFEPVKFVIELSFINLVISGSGRIAQPRD